MQWSSVEKCFQSWYGQSVIWRRRAFGVASNDDLAECWCEKDKVGVALATPAILRSPPMAMVTIPMTSYISME